MMRLKDISIESYGKYTSGNYGAHCLTFSIDCVDFYFSYQTLVAVRHPKHGLVCLKNYWTTTTGKHLNWIQPDHKARVSQEEFDKIVETISII